MFVSRQIASRLMNQTVRRYHAGENFKAPTMDELPVPRGSWQANYDAHQRKYNATLAIGIGFSIFTFIAAKSSGLIYLNFYPPKSVE